MHKRNKHGRTQTKMASPRTSSSLSCLRRRNAARSSTAVPCSTSSNSEALRSTRTKPLVKTQQTPRHTWSLSAPGSPCRRSCCTPGSAQPLKLFTHVERAIYSYSLGAFGYPLNCSSSSRWEIFLLPIPFSSTRFLFHVSKSEFPDMDIKRDFVAKLPTTETSVDTKLLSYFWGYLSIHSLKNR